MTFASSSMRALLAAAFTLAASNPYAAGLNSIAPAPARLATPKEQKQFRLLSDEVSEWTAPWRALQAQFDAGTLSATEYRAQAAELMARTPAASGDGTILPDILSPRLAGCTADGYSVSIPVQVKIDLQKLIARRGEGAQADTALIPVFEFMHETLRAAFVDFNTQFIAPFGRETIQSPMFQGALQSMFRKARNRLAEQSQIHADLRAGPPVTAETARCRIAGGPPAQP